MNPPPFYHISYYGLLADRRGLAEEGWSHAAATPAELYAAILASHSLGLAQVALRVAVNDEFVAWDHPLQNGDRIALLPPMSGG